MLLLTFNNNNMAAKKNEDFFPVGTTKRAIRKVNTRYRWRKKKKYRREVTTVAEREVLEVHFFFLPLVWSNQLVERRFVFESRSRNRIRDQLSMRQCVRAIFLFSYIRYYFKGVNTIQYWRSSGNKYWECECASSGWKIIYLLPDRFGFRMHQSFRGNVYVKNPDCRPLECRSAANCNQSYSTTRVRTIICHIGLRLNLQWNFTHCFLHVLIEWEGTQLQRRTHF